MTVIGTALRVQSKVYSNLSQVSILFQGRMSRVRPGPLCQRGTNARLRRVALPHPCRQAGGGATCNVIRGSFCRNHHEMAEELALVARWQR